MSRPARLRLAIAATLVAALPAASQQSKPAPTQLYIDVATHHMAGMPDMGGVLGSLGGMMARRMAGESARPTYPTTRGTGALNGQFLDMALHNASKPGVEAQDQVPAGLNLGKSLALVPVEPTAPGRGDTPPGQIPDIEFTISEYWGCGATVRPGQPKVASFKLKGGDKPFDPNNPMASMQDIDFQASSSLSRELRAGNRDIGLQPGWVYWPNRKHGKQVPSGARLAGTHRISGDGIPASMSFEVAQAADFMPRLALNAQGQPADAIQLAWPAVDRARAYFISGAHMQMLGQNRYALTLWSSAEAGGAGNDLHQYLGSDFIDRWLQQKVLLPASATGCVIPKGIFAGGSNVEGEAMTLPTMLAMTAYGPEHWITYPPRPSDPKQPWEPEWSVRLRAKSTATAMLGLDLGGMMQPDAQQQAPRQPEESTGKKLLRGLLNRGR